MDRIRVEYVPTFSMKADGMAKLLKRMRHDLFLEDLGLQRIRPRTSQSDETTRKDVGTNRPSVLYCIVLN